VSSFVRNSSIEYTQHHCIFVADVTITTERVTQLTLAIGRTGRRFNKQIH